MRSSRRRYRRHLFNRDGRRLSDELRAEPGFLRTRAEPRRFGKLRPADEHARNRAVFVDAELDLLTVAKWMAEDNSAEIGKLMQQQQFGLVSEEQAREFLRNNQEMWALVVAPWVLVQPIHEAK